MMRASRHSSLAGAGQTTVLPRCTCFRRSGGWYDPSHRRVIRTAAIANLRPLMREDRVIPVSGEGTSQVLVKIHQNTGVGYYASQRPEPVNITRVLRICSLANHSTDQGLRTSPSAPDRTGKGGPARSPESQILSVCRSQGGDRGGWQRGRASGAGGSDSHAARGIWGARAASSSSTTAAAGDGVLPLIGFGAGLAARYLCHHKAHHGLICSATFHRCSCSRRGHTRQEGDEEDEDEEEEEEEEEGECAGVPTS
uniref:Uncharacterized protein n=1 Tax=Oryza sativa subsp. japonica TaxID=39947 RepID=Q6F2T9_ORYSJ|nr:hypothetical protein [Oryza sativa Japonica Group]